MNFRTNNLFSYLNDLIGEDTENRIAEIKNSKRFMSLRKMSVEFNVSRHWLTKWIKNKLREKFGEIIALEIYHNLWTSSNFKANLKKDEFFKILNDQMRNFPIMVEKIDSIHTLSNNLGVSRRSITNWILEIFNNKFGRDFSQIIYKSIWNQKYQKKNISYDLIEERIKKRREVLITKKIDFSKMAESPTKRYIDVKCKQGHLWNVRSNSILYLDVTCPMCNDLKSEGIMRLTMEQLFGVIFPKTTLNSAYQILGREGGRLQFDGYNSKVNINNQNFRIAFEYDGIQHDLFPNGFHRSVIEYEKQRCNDEKKKMIASRFNTIIIRLKEHDGFTYRNKHIFAQEIKLLFQNETGIKIS